MPIVRKFSENSDAPEMSADDILFNGNGTLTLEGEVVKDFLKSVDMNPLFDTGDKDIDEGIERYTTTGTVIDDTIWEAKKEKKGDDDEEDDDEDEEDDYEESEDDDDEDDEEEEDDEDEPSGKKPAFGGKKAPPFKKKGDKDESVTLEGVEVEIIPGALAAELIDVDDLYGMFIEHICDMPTASFEDQLRVQAVLRHFDESEVLTEAPFAKGDFRKIRKGAKKTKNGLTGPAVVKSMLVAMMHKHAIKRAKAPAGYTPRGAGAPGTGYRGGDYEKDPAGYGAGTGAGRKNVMKFKKGHSAEIEKRAKKKKGYLKAKMAKQKKGAKKIQMVAAPKPPAKRSKAKEVAKAVSKKKKPTPRGAPGRSRDFGPVQHQTASDNTPRGNLQEGYVNGVQNRRNYNQHTAPTQPLYEGAGMAAAILSHQGRMEEHKPLDENNGAE